MSDDTKLKIYTPIFIVSQLMAAILIMLFVKIGNNLITDFINNLIFYILVFIVPTILFILKVLHNNPISYLNIKIKSIKPILIGLGICTFITVIFSITNRFQFKFDKINILILCETMLAGIFEEIPFRGFYQTFLKKRYGFIKSNIITSILFMVLHIKFFMSGDIIQLIMLFFISLWLGYIYEKTESIWAPIMVHSTFNFLIYIFGL